MKRHWKAIAVTAGPIRQLGDEKCGIRPHHEPGIFSLRTSGSVPALRYAMRNLPGYRAKRVAHAANRLLVLSNAIAAKNEVRPMALAEKLENKRFAPQYIDNKRYNNNH